MPDALSQTFRYSSWTQTILDTVRQEADYSSKWVMLPDESNGKAALVYMQPLYVSNVNITSTYVLMLVSPEKLESYLEADDTIKMAVLDVNGNIVAGNIEYPLDTTHLIGESGADEVNGTDGKTYIALTRPISCAGLSVAAVLPYATVQARVIPLRNSFLIAALLVILTTLALCMGFAVINCLLYTSPSPRDA